MSEPKSKVSKSILLQRRDQLFLLDLYDLQFLDVEYLEKHIYKGNSKPYIYRRVKGLEEEGYIQSFRVPILHLNNGQSKNVFALGKKGAKEVQSLRGELDWRYDVVTRTPSHVHHQLLLSHVRGSYEEERQIVEGEEQSPKDEKFEMVQYLNEKYGYFKYDPKDDPDKLGDKPFTIRPDGVLVLKNKEKGIYIPFFLELERSYQTKQTTIQKLERYNLYCQYHLFKEKHRGYDYPVTIPRILFISCNEKGTDRLLEHSKGIDTSATAGVLYGDFEDIISNPYGKIFFGKDSNDPKQLYSLVDKIEK
ncbi:replication-relaxation family protein [Priestia megaterium]|uniref:replication-relaxation family protein n=1 Tax=Priestia megaterium TaxID=1404 RepID=UPI00159BA6E4|nr:replication-relaxation family protein [Priestia megaterium]